MSAILQLAARPDQSADGSTRSRYRAVGLALSIVALMGAAVSVVGNFAAAAGIDSQNSYAETLAWTFGLSIFSFGLLKISIAILLMGIVVRLWFRVDTVGDALLSLRATDSETTTTALGPKSTEFGRAIVTKEQPKLLTIHRMARSMWRPMLAIGAMALTAGLISSFVWASETPASRSAREAAAFTQGIQFLGETFLLTGIAFLLGTILAGLREGGGEVQSGLGLPVTTLRMPNTAKAFVALMAMGLMAGIAQFIGYLYAIGAADDTASFSSWMNWLGPFRELALGLVLAGIVLALVTIGNVLGFQFDRVKSIIRTGV